MISDKLLEKIRKLRKDLDNLPQEHFEKGIKLFAATKAEAGASYVKNVISKNEYNRLSKNPEYNQAAEIVTDTLTLLEELDNLEWVYNDMIRKLYHSRPEIPKVDADDSVYSLEPPFTRSKFLS